MAMERKIFLSEKELAHAWYNVQADLPKPLAPPIHPGTKQPLGPADLAPIFAMELIKQEVSQERWVEIPPEVRDVLSIWRPTPLVRAVNLEKKLGTPARIYYKNESVSPAGSHKPNTSVPQAYYNKKQGITRLATETGAGQWGSALSFACSVFGLKCKVYMVRVSFDQKPYRKSLMRLWGAEIVASPSMDTKVGRDILAKTPNSSGSLGIAISEAVEDTVTHENTRYTLGSVLNHVLMHQTVIGLEAQKQLQLAGDKADILIGCTGGGSNFGGLVLPYVPEKLKSRPDIRLIAVEPTACPTLTKGPFRYDFGDTAGMTPLVKMHTLGHTFMPSGIHAGGLRYHGMAPIVSHLKDLGIVEAVAYSQNPVFDAAVMFANEEGIVPAPESSHAIRAAVDEALRCKAEKKSKAIVFSLSGHGHFDLTAYDAYLNGKLEDFEHPEDDIAEALKHLPTVE
jgi:tryptophan synthase beta chain